MTSWNANTSGPSLSDVESAYQSFNASIEASHQQQNQAGTTSGLSDYQAPQTQVVDSQQYRSDAVHAYYNEQQDKGIYD